MDKPSFNFGGVNLDVGLGSQRQGRPVADDPFRIAILGDFSGRASRGIRESGGPLRKRKPVLIDRDNFDDVFRRFAVELEMPVAGRIRLKELDDFHPDRLYESLAVFEPLRQARAEAGRGGAVAAPKKAAASVPPPAPEALGNLLEGALQATEGRREGAATRDPLRSWVDQQVQPHLAPAEPAGAKERRTLVDRVISAQMSALLHYPDLQALESLWRSVFFLVRRAETDTNLSIWLVDVSREELDGGLAEVSDLLSDHKPWALLVGAYSFGTAPADIQTLAAAGAIASKFGSSFIAGAKRETIGCGPDADPSEPTEWKSPDPIWDALRSSPVARHIGVVWPRFLVRLPYGAKTDACERIPFEEMSGDHDPERMLWGNPAILSALLLAESFVEDGWSMRPGTHSNAGRLPVYVYEADGESVAQPCAEILMTERAARAIQENGVMCLASIKGSDEVKLVRFQSIAKPPGQLAGVWQ